MPVTAVPAGHTPHRHRTDRDRMRRLRNPLVGLATVGVIGAIVAGAVGLFQGSFTQTVPVTVLSSRAGLVMNTDAKVEFHGVQVGKVASIKALPGGQAALHLAMDPALLHVIPANVVVDIASSTAFGAKFVEMLPPADPSAQSVHAGQTFDSRHVTVETNTIFEQLTSVLAKIEPAKLNETLGALTSGMNGRGHEIGHIIADFDAILTKLEPSRRTLEHDLAVAPAVFGSFADAAPDLVRASANTVQLSQTIVDEQHNLDALLISTIGLADIGNQVLGDNRGRLKDVTTLLLPTTDLLSQYHQALTCGIAGLSPVSRQSALKNPGITLLSGLDFGADRYRYPQDLPRVAAKGGPQCTDLPIAPFGAHPPFVVADVGANQWRYGNQSLFWNSDLIKQWLFGPIDGPPRNTAQIGQPG
jgi:phospholipid/cholesterol/gamma-HCH transport system substrate-binding protein